MGKKTIGKKRPQGFNVMPPEKRAAIQRLAVEAAAKKRREIAEKARLYDEEQAKKKEGDV